MGLGKTLTMIALAATDQDRNIDVNSQGDEGDDDRHKVAATLIVVPPPRMSSNQSIDYLHAPRHHY